MKFRLSIQRVSTRPNETFQAMTWTLQPIAQFADFADQWDALARSRPGTPFLESVFLQPAVEIFGRGDERLCLNHVNGQLRAAGILQPGRKGMWQTFQPSQLPLGAWITEEGVDLASACSALMGQLPGLALGLGVTSWTQEFTPGHKMAPNYEPRITFKPPGSTLKAVLTPIGTLAGKISGKTRVSSETSYRQKAPKPEWSALPL